MPRRLDPAALDRFLDELGRTRRLARAIAVSGCSRSALFKRRARDPVFAGRWVAALAGVDPRRRPGRARIGPAAERLFLGALLWGATIRAAAARTGFSHASFYARARQSQRFAALLRDVLRAGADRRLIRRLKLDRPMDRDPEPLLFDETVPDPSISVEQALIQLHLHNPNLRFQRNWQRRRRPPSFDRVRPEIIARFNALARFWHWQETGNWLG